VHAGRCEDIFVIAKRHLGDIRRRRADLERMERRLAPLVEKCCEVVPSTARRNQSLRLNDQDDLLPDGKALERCSAKAN
jgi:hypothetical protein